MTENLRLSLRDALIWKNNEIVSVSELVAALHIFQRISKKEALIQIGHLIIAGLPICDKTKTIPEESIVEKVFALGIVACELYDCRKEYISLLAKNLAEDITKDSDEISVDKEVLIEKIAQEIIEKDLSEFSNLVVFRHETFKIFAKLRVKEPYPWAYPIEWLSSDFLEYMWANIDVMEETTSTTTIQSTELLTADQQRLPSDSTNEVSTLLSDAAFGAQQREQRNELARSRQSARQLEWVRWKLEGHRIQSGIERRLKNLELAEKIKKSLHLPDSVHTIRQRI